MFVWKSMQSLFELLSFLPRSPLWSSKRREMPTSDVAADMSSSESLSFAGMVCIQEQYSTKSHPVQAPAPYHQKKITQIPKADTNFEFSYSTEAPMAVNLQNKSPSNNLLLLKPDRQSQVYGQVTMKDILDPHGSCQRSSGPEILPRAITLQPDHQSLTYGQVTVQDVLQPRSRSQRSISNEIGNGISAKKANTEVRKHASKENSGGFGQKFIQSITTPCRTCRAIEPSPSVRATKMSKEK